MNYHNPVFMCMFYIKQNVTDFLAGNLESYGHYCDHSDNCHCM